MRIVIIMQRDSQLLQIVFALTASRRFTCLLDRRQQQSNQRRNDGNDDKKFNQRKSTSL